MQLIQACGIDLLCDSNRAPDQFNQKGYWESDLVKRGHSYQSWFGNAQGKAVKIVAPLLNLVPSQENVVFVYCVRNVHDIVTSQNNMIGSQNSDAESFKQSLTTAYQQLIITLSALKEKNSPVCIIEYETAIKQPEITAKQLVSFLGMGDADSVVKTIDPSQCHFS